MKSQNVFTSILLCIISINVMAETDFSAIEAQERAQIISELTYRLDTKQNCDQTLNWDDSGSGADLDGYFFIPNVKGSEYIIGGHASGKRTSDYHCTTTVSVAADNPKQRPPLLATPTNWKQVWKDSGSGAAKDGSFWQAIPPDDNYKCIGSVSQLNHNSKPNIPNYRCVHKSLTDKIVASTVVWSDKGTGADQQVTVFSLPATGAYIAVATRLDKIEAYDLKKTGVSVPDPKMVEDILARRMAPLKADIEMKAQAIQEQKEAAKKAEAKKAEAKKAEAKKEETEKAKQEKPLVVTEKKKQEVPVEKAPAAKTDAKQKQDERAAEQKLKAEQQARIAKVMAEKEATKKAEAEKAQQEKANQAAARSESKSEPEVEVVAKASTSLKEERVEPVESSSESTSANEDRSESKGLSDILMFFLKVFGIMIGGVIVFMIAFKALFGKKTPTGK